MDEQEVNPLELEQEQILGTDEEVPLDTVVEAPESVPTAVTQEAGTDVPPPIDSSLQGLVQYEGALPKSKRSNRPAPILAPFVQKKTPLNSEGVEFVGRVVQRASVMTNGEDLSLEQAKNRVINEPLDAVRDSIAQKDLEQRKGAYLQSLQSLINENVLSAEELAGELQQAATLRLNRAALEENAVTSMMLDGAKDPEWLAIFEESGTLTDDLQNQIESQVLLQNYLAQKQSEAEKDFDFGRDFIRALTPLDMLTKVFGFGANWADGMKEFGREFNAARTTEAKLEVLEKFDEEVRNAVILGGLFGQNPDFDADVANTAFKATPIQRVEGLALTGIEGVLTLVGMGQTAKALKGAKAAKNIESKLGVKSPQDTLKESQEGDLEATGRINVLNDPSSPIPPEYPQVRAVLERQQRALDDTAENIVSPKIRNEEEQLPVFNNGTVRSQTIEADGSVTTEFVTSKGNPFARKSTAESRASQLGLKDYTVEQDGAGWVVKVRSELDAWGAPKQLPESVGVIRRWIDNIDNWVDGVIHAKGRLAEASYSNLERTFRTVWKNGLGPLSTGQRKDLGRVLEKLRQENTDGSVPNRWYSNEEFIQEYKALTGRAPTDKDIVGYNTFRQLNDFAYRVDNQVLYEQAQNAGYTGVKVDFTEVPLTGKFRVGLKDDAVVYDRETGKSVSVSELGNKDDYDFIEINARDKSDLIEAGLISPTRSSVIAVRKGTAEQVELNPIQIKYRAGGRVQYDNNTVWLKQANVMDADGARLRMRDRTMYRANTMAEAKDYADRWNKARVFVKELGENTATPSARAAFRDFDLGELDDFLQNAKAYKWNLDEDMVPVRNRQVIELPSTGGLVDETSDLDYIVEGVGNRFSQRGQGVPHILGDAGDGPLDPLASLSQSVDLTARNGAFGVYRQAALERFKQLYGRYLDIDPTAPLTSYLRASPNRLAQQNNLSESIVGHQNYIKEVMNMQFKDERYWNRKVDSMAEWALGKDFKFVSGTTVSRGINGLRDLSPAQQLRSLTFNAKLGLGNIASFSMQVLQAPIIAATVPEFGVRALSYVPVFRMALYGIDDLNEGVWKEFAAKMAKLDDGPNFLGDFREAVKEFRRLGMDNFGGNMAYVDAAVGNNVLKIGITGIGEKLGRVADKGRVFFNEGEMIPRMVSYMSARARWLSDPKLNPKGLPATSDAGRQWINNQTDKYMLGMSRADIQQALRGGVIGFATQFYSFILRATAAFAGKTFTKAEKIRMGMGYLAMYGTAAVPLGDMALDAIMGDQANSELAEVLRNGIVDGVASAVLGYETNMKDRAALGTALEDIVGGLLGKDSFMETLAGAPGSTGHRALDGIIDVMRMYNAVSNPSTVEVTAAAALSVGRQISSFNNVYKAIQSWETGILLDNKGLPYMPVSKAELVGQILGIPTVKYAELNEIYTSESKRKSAIDDGVKDVTSLMQMAAEAFSEEDRAKYEQAIAHRMNALRAFGIDDEVSRRVFQSLSGQTSYERKLIQYIQMRNEEGSDGFTKSYILDEERLKEIKEQRQ